ncbi:hypothetical protein LTR37_000421 [Vermiconidia calcicola]|uniref:Uncharacterized protein n=1 Tax=Vermiconidia calcicola TaxID=1690605 RepID=A0ACC3P1B7_9PEZI|nr:hypothetical protein LTR37_000421 [Vermiconidia calcicola]
MGTSMIGSFGARVDHKISSHAESTMAPVVRVAICHIASIYLDAAATTEKVLSWIGKASQNGAHLVVFPEVCIPAYPHWSCLISPAETHDFFIRMAKESIYADGEEMAKIRHTAKQNRIFVSLGFSEKARYSSATLWNSNMVVSADGGILVHHRKLMPTFHEKLTWAQGDGHGLKVVDIPIIAARREGAGSAKLGMLICGENTNPLARYAMIAQGEQIHITTWPAKAAHRVLLGDEESSVDDSKDASLPVRGKYDNLAVNRTRCSEHCFEAKCFGIICASFMSPEIIDYLVADAPEHAKGLVKSTYELAAQAESRFLDTSGSPIPGFTVDVEGNRNSCESLRHEEGMLYADLDMEQTIEGKQYHDVVGAYQRFDVFNLTVDTSRKMPCNFR